jgi:hypothetical protein
LKLLGLRVSLPRSLKSVSHQNQTPCERSQQPPGLPFAERCEKSGNMRGRNANTAENSTSSECDRVKRTSIHTSGHIEQLAQRSHRCVQARSAYGPTSTPSTRPIQTNVSVATDHRRHDTSCLNAGTGWKNDIECGQASLHAVTSSAFSVTRQWQYKQPR